MFTFRSRLNYVTVCRHLCFMFFFFFNQMTAYELRISDWSSDACSSDLPAPVEIAVDDNLAAVQHRADPAGRQVVEAQRAPRQQGAQKLCRAGIAAARTEESRVGKECGRTCRSRWSRFH